MSKRFSEFVNSFFCLCGMHTYVYESEVFCKNYAEDKELCKDCTTDDVCRKYIKSEIHKCVHCNATKEVNSVV